jgi:hypothetical protein
LSDMIGTPLFHITCNFRFNNKKIGSEKCALHKKIRTR